MDVNACMEALVKALEDSDYEEAQEQIGNIRDWMQRGGFAPTLDFATTDFLLGKMSDILPKWKRTP